MSRRIRDFNWVETALGPAHEWPHSLKAIVRMMLDSRFGMWMALGPELLFLCNDAYLPTVGLRKDWVLGARSDKVWEEVWNDAGPRIQHVMSTATATWDQGLQLFLRRNGYTEETFHTFSYSPVYDDENRTMGMLCVVVEDTARALNERRFKLLRELTIVTGGQAASLQQAGQLLLSALAPGVEDIPFAALYLTTSQADRVELAGATTPGAHLHAPDAGNFSDPDCEIGQAVLRGEEKHLTRLNHSMGAIRGAWGEPVREALVFPLFAAGQPVALGAVVLGISTRRRLDTAYHSFLRLIAHQFTLQLTETQARLVAQRRAEALAELDHAKNVFFSNVSHELRTPLTLMLGPVEDLLTNRGLADGLPRELTDTLRLVQRNGQRLRKLVNTLLEFSRLEAGQVKAERQLTELGAFTTDVASVFRSAIESAGLRFIVRCDPLPTLVHIDRDMWEKIVLNLLSNAFKFTLEGEIEIALESMSGHARLTVRDTGTGISAQALPHIFERFYRVEGALARSQEGTGIGLALIKELIQLQQGSIEVASTLGEGTVFTVLIPIEHASLALSAETRAEPAPSTHSVEAVSFVDDALRGTHSLFAAKAPASSKGFVAHAPQLRERILVVDDNADMRGYIQRLLERYWTVETAANGLDAWGLIQRSPPELVITDLMMPGMGGRELLQQLRTHASTQTLPVIVLSAQAGEEARVAGLHQGADDYLVKPFATAELLARIELQLMRSRMRRAEQGQHRRLLEVFRNAPVAVALFSGPDHVYEFANPLYESFATGRELIGRPVRLAIPELEEQGVLDLLDLVYTTGKPQVGHAYPVRLLDAASGGFKEHYFEFVLQPLEAEGEESPGIAMVSVDVTELATARSSAEAANRSKDEFIAILGHELRNPLAPISTALQMMKLREGASGPNAARELQIIERQVRHMTRLIDDLLDVSRITRGNVALKRRPMELREAVEHALETASPLFERKRHTLVVQVPQEGLPIYGDEVRLCQVISNLLNNAAHYTAEEGQVQVAAWQEGEHVVLTVRDNGIGMTPAELDNVFELFVQGIQGIERPRGGLGLGLTIARSLATLHGGALSATSKGPQQGSEFRLTLPLHSASAAPALVSAAPVLHANGKQRLLIVDDNVDAAQTIATLLEFSGHYATFIAHDAPTALELLQRQEIDVALIDIGLPVMDGYELAQHIHHKHGKEMRLIALSGYGHAKDVERSQNAGFALHLVKPVQLDVLLPALEGTLTPE